MDEIHLNAYENAIIYKEQTNRWHDQLIHWRQFIEGDIVLLYNSRLKLFLGKLNSRWSGPFKVQKVFLNGAMEIESKTN